MTAPSGMLAGFLTFAGYMLTDSTLGGILRDAKLGCALILALMAAFNLESAQYDFGNAFPDALLDEEIYMQLPPSSPQRHGYWKLLRALYGLRRSPLLWHNELSGHF
ncbi:hypothetical protein MY3296_007858 [Beauveria thailandica]